MDKTFVHIMCGCTFSNIETETQILNEVMQDCIVQGCKTHNNKGRQLRYPYFSITILYLPKALSNVPTIDLDSRLLKRNIKVKCCRFNYTTHSACDMRVKDFRRTPCEAIIYMYLAIQRLAPPNWHV